VVLHSDRGGRFRARSFVAVLKAAGLVGSMGHVASAGGNAAMESFHSLLQKNVLDRHRWATRDDLTNATLHWMSMALFHGHAQLDRAHLQPAAVSATGKAHPGRVRARVATKLASEAA
jgi:putative transposase